MTCTEKAHIAHDLLSRGHSPTTASRIFKEKVLQKPLLLRPTSPDPVLDARSQRQRARLLKAAERRKSRKPQPLSAKQKRALCIYEIPKEQRKYAIYEPLHALWVGYMRGILGVDGVRDNGYGAYVTPQGAGPLIASADFHGAEVEVVRSRCVSRVGLKGIVVKDTKFTFEVITKSDELKTVPKEHTVFRFEIPLIAKMPEGEQEGEKLKSLVFELHGSQFENRAPDRANKKFKLHIDPDL
ncbi:hypothetical protein LTR04_002933 [Oleoguttula sp. CCFEE 6159]|nr:hypothetical protein LTR04_002933 [Oleoguttula sp. CCFEE 6159]